MAIKQRKSSFHIYGVAFLMALVVLAFGYLAGRQSAEIVALSRQQMKLTQDMATLRHDVTKLQAGSADGTATAPAAPGKK